MSVRLNLTISTPKDQTFYDRFFSFTHRIGDVRVLIEVSKPNMSDFLDINAEYVFGHESDSPGLYGNFVVFGIGLHFTAYGVAKK